MEENPTHLVPSLSSISESRDRVNALFSPFRPRSLNPDSYDLKHKFWRKAWEEWLEFGGFLSFSLKEAQKGLMLGQKTPACLQEVLDQLVKEKVVLTLGEYEDLLRAQQSWWAWSSVTAKRTLFRVIPTITIPFFGSKEEVRYVHLEHLKALVSSLLKDLELKRGLMGSSEFQDLLLSKTGIKSETDLEILLAYFRAFRYLQVDCVGQEEIVLFGEQKAGCTITQVDKGRYDVTRTLKIYEHQLDDIQAQMENCVESAKKALKQGRRGTAKHEIRKKKLLEQRVDKLHKVLDSLTVIAHRLDEAESDLKILEAYESGKKALKEVLSTNNVTVDSVTEAMLDLQDVLEEQKEINEAIAKPVEEDLDDEELNLELEQMLEEDKKREEEDETLRRLANLKVRDATLEDQDSLIGGNLDLDEKDVPSPASVSSEF